MLNHSTLRFLLAAFLTSGLCSTAMAAPINSLPNSVDPSNLEKQYRSNARPKLDRSPAISAPKQEEIADAEAGASFVLKEVRVTGSTAFSSPEIQALFKDNINKSVTLGGLRTIASELTNQYRNRGYILSKAVIPPQRINDGMVVIEVIEGYIDNVVYQGGSHQNQALLASYAEKIKASKPLKNSDLERYLLLLDDLTGVDARGILSASSSARGASSLTITLEEKTTEGTLSLDNRGSRYLGPWQAGLSLAENSLLGLSEQIGVRAITSSDLDELQYYEANLLQHFGSEGFSLRLLGSYTDSEPGSSLEIFDIEGKNLSFSAEAMYPLLRSRQENVYLGGGMRYRDAETDTLGVNLYEDNIRALFANIAYDTLGGLDAINRIDAEITQGITALGANDSGDVVSRANGENSFTKLNATYSRLQPLTDNISWFVAAQGRISNKPLLASEEFNIGGVNFGSAYDAAEILGDRGYGARTELRFSDALPESIGSIYQLYAFYDGGKVFNKETLASEQKSESLTSAGVGARLNLLENLYATAEIAKPLTRDVDAEGDDDVRGFMSLTYGF